MKHLRQIAAIIMAVCLIIISVPVLPVEAAEQSDYTISAGQFDLFFREYYDFLQAGIIPANYSRFVLPKSAISQSMINTHVINVYHSNFFV